MQLCVTAEMKYNQFQPSTMLFVIGYPRTNYINNKSVHICIFKDGRIVKYIHILTFGFHHNRLFLLCDKSNILIQKNS